MDHCGTLTEGDLKYIVYSNEESYTYKYLLIIVYTDSGEYRRPKRFNSSPKYKNNYKRVG